MRPLFDFEISLIQVKVFGYQVAILKTELEQLKMRLKGAQANLVSQEHQKLRGPVGVFPGFPPAPLGGSRWSAQEEAPCRVLRPTGSSDSGVYNQAWIY